jgi:hypothetical protein
MAVSGTEMTPVLASEDVTNRLANNAVLTRQRLMGHAAGSVVLADLSYLIGCQFCSPLALASHLTVGASPRSGPFLLTFGQKRTSAGGGSIVPFVY